MQTRQLQTLGNSPRTRIRGKDQESEKLFLTRAITRGHFSHLFSPTGWATCPRMCPNEDPHKSPQDPNMAGERERSPSQNLGNCDGSLLVESVVGRGPGIRTRDPLLRKWPLFLRNVATGARICPINRLRASRVPCDPRPRLCTRRPTWRDPPRGGGCGSNPGPLNLKSALFLRNSATGARMWPISDSTWDQHGERNGCQPGGDDPGPSAGETLRFAHAHRPTWRELPRGRVA